MAMSTSPSAMVKSRKRAADVRPAGWSPDGAVVPSSQVPRQLVLGAPSRYLGTVSAARLPGPALAPVGAKVLLTGWHA